MKVLSVEGLTMRFGGLTAVDGVSFQVDEGEILGIIGPNGAGKTTLFNMITGFLVPTEGSVEFLGRQLRGLPAHRITGLGICRTFQTIRLFPKLSVLENVLIGMHTRRRFDWMEPFRRLAKGHTYRDAAIEAALRELEFVDLEKRAWEKAGALPYGEQRRLEIARALASSPRLVLLDEPAAGMNPSEGASLRKTIRDIVGRGVSVILIEHHMRVVMGTSDRVVVLSYGKKIAEGTPREVQSNPEVIAAYLGEKQDGSVRG